MRRNHYPAFTSLRRRSHAREQAPSGPACERCGETSGDVKQIETKHGPERVCYPCRLAHAEAKQKEAKQRGVLDHAV